MKNSFKVALATVALTALSGAAHADLNINGAVGLPLNPTAQIPDQGGLRIQGNYYRLGNGIKDYGLVAAVQATNNIEVNGGVTRLDGAANERTGVAIGAKYLITRESDPAGVRFAVGVGYDRALAKQSYVYGVATKYLGEISADKVPITGHLGIRYDRFSDADSKKASVFAGIEVPVVSNGSVQAVGEIQSKNFETGGKIPYSASVRFRPQGRPFGASIGIARQGGTGDNGLFAQIGYTFGK